MQVTAQTLHDAFIPFGEIVDVALPKPELYVQSTTERARGDSRMLTRYSPSNRDPHRGFGYVEFSLAEDAREAIDNMDQSELYGRVLKVNQAKPQKNAGEGLGSRTAICSYYPARNRNRELVLTSNYRGARRICEQVQCQRGANRFGCEWKTR